MGKSWGFRRVYNLVVLAFMGVVVVVIAVGFWFLHTSPHSFQPGKMIRTIDGLHGEQARFDAAVAMVRASGQGHAGFAMIDISGEFSDLSAHAYAETWGEVVFFPQWLAEGPGGGGFFHMPTGSPEGYDMHGQMCTGPIDLGGGWWACGMEGPVETRWSDEESDSNAWLWIAVVVIFAAGGLVDWQTRRARNASTTAHTSWVRVPATVTASSFRRLNPMELHSEGRRRQRKGVFLVESSESPYQGCLADIRYTYVLGDLSYTSDRVSVVPELTEAAAVELVDRYPVGARVEAWVNPSDVTDAMLEPGRTAEKIHRQRWAVWYVYGFGLVFLLVATGVLG